MNDVLINKKASIERCIAQVNKYYNLSADIPFVEDHLRQDAVSMNLQRACEQAIDMANLIIRRKKLGVPQASRDSFDLLQQAGLINKNLCERMKNMVGFRNLLVHAYQRVEIVVLEDVIQHHLKDLTEFAGQILEKNS